MNRHKVRVSEGARRDCEVGILILRIIQLNAFMTGKCDCMLGPPDWIRIRTDVGDIFSFADDAGREFWLVNQIRGSSLESVIFTKGEMENPLHLSRILRV